MKRQKQKPGVGPGAEGSDDDMGAEDGDDEIEDTRTLEAGTIVLLCNLPDNLRALENCEAAVILYESVQKSYGKSEKVLVKTVQSAKHGVSQTIRLPIHMIELPPAQIVAPIATLKSTFSKVFVGIAAGLDAAMQLFSRPAVQPPVDISEDEADDGATASGASLFQFRLVKPRQAVGADQSLVGQGNSDAYSEYMKSVTEWKVALYYKGIVATDTTIFGPYEAVDMKYQLAQAAARCGFNISDPHGMRNSDKSCSFYMSCSCGRERCDKPEPRYI